jgi:hypothetical protein
MAQLKSTNVLGNISASGNVIASKFIKLNGTGDDILLANGETANLKALGAGSVTSVGITNGGGLTVTGSPITGSGSITISHADTSTQASLTTGGRTYINQLTLDEYGHVTAIGTGTESNQDLSAFVAGPSTSTDNAIAIYDGATGKAIKNSAILIGTGNQLDVTGGSIKLNKIYAPKSSGSTEYTTGTNKQVLKSNGTTVYWASDSNADTQIRIYRQTSGYNADYPIIVSRTALSSIGTAGSNDTYSAVYGVIGNNGTNTPTINPNTGLITAKGFKYAGLTTPENYLLTADGSYIEKSAIDATSSTLQTVTDNGNTTTNNITVKDLTISSTEASGHIKFSRNSYNFITANSGTSAVLSFLVGNNVTVSSENSQLNISSGCVFPGKTGTIDLGKTSYVFKDLYMSGTIKKGSYTYTLPSKTGTLALTTDIPDPVTPGNGTLTMATSGTGLNLSTTKTFTANQSGNTTITYTLDSSAAGNRTANQVVLAKAAGQIDSEKYCVTSGATSKCTIQYSTTEGCLEFVF